MRGFISNIGRKIVTENYENGMLKSESEFLWGKRDGSTKQYYEDGILMIEAGFRNGKPEGRFRQYYEDGTIMAEEFYSKGQLVLQKRFDENGRLSDSVRKYYSDGRLMIESAFRMGKPDGISRQFFENGSLKAEEFYRDGTLISRKNYDKMGNLEGPVREFFSNGAVHTETDFKEGVFKEFFKSGSLKLEARFKNGKPHGLMKQYHDGGQLIAEDGYEEGKFIGSRRYGDDGRIASATGKLAEEIKNDKHDTEVITDFFARSTADVKKEPAPLPELKIALESHPPKPPAPKAVVKPAQPAPVKEIVAHTPAVEENIFIAPKEAPVQLPEISPEEITATPAREDNDIDQVIKEIEGVAAVNDHPAKEDQAPPEEDRTPAAEERIETPQMESPKAPSVPVPEASVTGDEKIEKANFPNGKLRSEKRYVNGKLNGLTKEYYETGELMTELIYKDGEIAGRTVYDKTGKFMYKSNVKT